MVGTGRFERLRRHERRPLAGVSCALALLAPHIGVLVSAVRRAGSAKIFFSERLVGTGRFELPTPRTPSECSTRLSHVPTLVRTRSSNGVDSEILHQDRCFPGRTVALLKLLTPNRISDKNALGIRNTCPNAITVVRRSSLAASVMRTDVSAIRDARQGEVCWQFRVRYPRQQFKCKCGKLIKDVAQNARALAQLM